MPPGAIGFCEACAPLLEPRPGAIGAFVYGGPLADALQRFKYGGRSDLAAPLGALLAKAAGRHAGHVDAVVPVPLHRRRLRTRGFDQTALLARPVARALGVAFEPRRLVRTRATPPQVGLDAAARSDNVRGAFLARPRPRRPRVLLLDDVRTTGATLEAAARALQAAGTREVRLITLAIAE